MSREDIQKLLGGYATDTLSEAERRALFEAALDDQELFDALAKEEALRDVLRDRSARLRLMEALGPAREPVAGRGWGWLRRPAVLAIAGAAAVVLIVGGIVLRETRRTAHQEVTVADAIGPTTAPASNPAQVSQPALVSPKAKRNRPAKLPQAQLAKGFAAVEPVAPPAAAAPGPSGAAGVGGFPNNGAVAGTAEKKSLMLPRAPEARQRFVAQDGLALGLPVRAKASAIQYALLLKDANDVYVPVPAGTVFHTGDSVRVQVTPGESGFVDLFQRDANSGWRLVAGQAVEKGQSCVLPPTDSLHSDTPAELAFRVVLSGGADQQSFASPPRGEAEIVIEFR
ncbi:MAG TPA: hypothetical protein VMR62_33090 [Bryobacteraceae bacterium]|jgi:hypothetical protein|nr:hypothetical protein [Bryobacteraceae bacterium]